MTNSREDYLLISVIMPVYNSDKYLSGAVMSVLNQTYSHFELLLIDDGSEDNSPALCDDFGMRDDRVRVFHKENGGVCSARNLGLRESKGEYIAFIDDDDLYKPEFLETMVARLRSQRTDIIQCGRKNVWISARGNFRGMRVSAWHTTQSFDHKGFAENYYDLKKAGILSSVWNGLYRRQFLVSNQITFNENFKHGNEDVYFNICCFFRCIDIAVVHDVLYEHFIRNGHSTSLKYHKDQVMDCLETIFLEQQFLKLEKGSRRYELAIMGNIRLCFKLLSVSHDRNERNSGIRILRERLLLNEFEQYHIFSYSELSWFEKIELLMIKKRCYNWFFMLQTLKHG